MTETPAFRIHHGLEGIEAIEGAVVVIDVFRASNTIISLLASGAREVALFADLEQARAFKRAEPKRPLLGERGGIAPDDFDGGNSPSNAPRVVPEGAAPILTTSAGTQAVARLTSADLILFASFANAAAVVRVLNEIKPLSVTLLPMGLEAREPAVEDDEAARWLLALLEGETPDFTGVRDRLLSCSGADRLRRLGQSDDLEWCTTVDSRSVVPMVRLDEPPRAVCFATR